MIMTLGYIPDRAYYFTVQNTVDLGLLAWSPINFCPPANETLPCPAPPGATLPWHPAPPELQLPGGRTDGAAGSRPDLPRRGRQRRHQAPSPTTYLAKAVGTGNFDKWAHGPALPEARSDAAFVTIGNTMYVIGGYGPDGKPTEHGVQPHGRQRRHARRVGDRRRIDAARGAGRRGRGRRSRTASWSWAASTVGRADRRPSGRASRTRAGKLQAVGRAAPLVEENVDGVAAHVGDCDLPRRRANAAGQPGRDGPAGPLGGPGTTTAEPNRSSPVARQRADQPAGGPRTNMSGLHGERRALRPGRQRRHARPRDYWTTPDADGVIPEWLHLDQTDLGAGRRGLGRRRVRRVRVPVRRRARPGPTNGAGAHVPRARSRRSSSWGSWARPCRASQLGGEVGQQIGYMNAAGVGTVNFILLILLGWAFAHKAKVRAMVAERRRRREAKGQVRRHSRTGALSPGARPRRVAAARAGTGRPIRCHASIPPATLPTSSSPAGAGTP